MRRPLVAFVLAVAMIAVAPPVAANAVSRAFFGVSPLAPLEEADFEAMGQGQVGTLRINFLWSSIQPEEDEPFDWARTDELVGLASENGVQVLPVLYGAPDWAVSCAGETDASCERVAPTSPEGLAGWSAFVRATAERYGPGGDFWAEPGAPPYAPIRVWQAWNEQNTVTYYRPHPNPRRYAKLLKATHKSLRAVDRRAKVVMGGMPGTPTVDAWAMLRRLYKVRGIKKRFNAVAMHPYAPGLRGVREQIERLRKAMKAGGDKRTPLWITELSWGSGTPGAGSALQKGPAGQKRMLKKAFKMLLKNRREWKIKRIVWFSWRDPSSTSGECGFCDTAGLHNADLSPKPSWDAYTKFTGGS